MKQVFYPTIKWSSIIGFFILFLGCSGSRDLVSTPPENPLCRVNHVDQSKLVLDTIVGDEHHYDINYWVLTNIEDTTAFDASVIDNTDLLNDELKSYFNFSYNNKYILQDLKYDLDYIYENDSIVRPHLSSIFETDGEINIVIVPTYSSLKGYTVTFPTYHEGYLYFAPKYDFIFISLESFLAVNRDLIHEICHYFGGIHTFEIEDPDFAIQLGLTSAEKLFTNDMGYMKKNHRKILIHLKKHGLIDKTNGLTPQQKARMWNFAARYRHNGIQQ